MSLSGRVWPTPPLIHCICLRVIPHPHLFNFTRQTFFCVCLLLSHTILITHGLCFGREEIDGFDQCLVERESWGNAETQNRTTAVDSLSFMFELLFLAWRGYSLKHFFSSSYGTFKKLICLYREGHPSAKWFMKMWYSYIFLSLSET